MISLLDVNVPVALIVPEHFQSRAESTGFQPVVLSMENIAVLRFRGVQRVANIRDDTSCGMTTVPYRRGRTSIRSMRAR